MKSPRKSSAVILLSAAILLFASAFVQAAEDTPPPPDRNPQYFADLAAIHMRYGDVEKAIELYTRAVELSGDNIDPRIALGLCTAYLKTGKVDDADFIFELPLKTMKQQKAQYMASAAKLYQEHEHYEKAEAILKRAQDAIADERDEMMVIQQLLSLYRTTPLGRRVIAENEQRLRENPEDAEALRTLMDLYFYATEFEKAAEMAERYAKLNPTDIKALNELVLHYVTSGELERAIGVCERLIELDEKGRPTHYARIIQAYAHLENQQAIDKWAERIADDGIVSGEVYTSLAVAYAKAGKVEDALAFYRKAIEIRPDDNAVQFMYASLLVEQGRLAEALPVLEKLENTPDSRLRPRVQQLLLRVYRDAKK